MIIDAIRTAGKTHATSIPALRSSFLSCEVNPTNQGPNAPPRSPAIARRANIAVPPAGSLLDKMLIVPGHIIPTENPQRIQPVRHINGLRDKAARI